MVRSGVAGSDKLNPRFYVLTPAISKNTMSSDATSTPTAPAQAAPKPPAYAWQTCLDVQNTDGHVYETHFNPSLLEVLAHPPRVLLDVGCSSGILGATVKARNPRCRTIGIEPNIATAKTA